MALDFLQLELIRDNENGHSEVLSLSLDDIIALERLLHIRLAESLSAIQPNPLGISPVAALPLRQSFVAPNSLKTEVVLGLQDILDVTIRYRLSREQAFDLSARLLAAAEKKDGPTIPN